MNTRKQHAMHSNCSARRRHETVPRYMHLIKPVLKFIIQSALRKLPFGRKFSFCLYAFVILIMGSLPYPPTFIRPQPELICDD